MYQLTNKQILRRFRLICRVAALFAASIVLAGCATGRHVLTAEDITDDGKRNTILFSYDMTLNVTEKYPQITNTEVVIRCIEPNRQKHANDCVRVNVPLRGRRDIGDYSFYTFAGKGAAVLQMPYGVFNLESVGHSVVVDVQRFGNCFGGFYGGFGLSNDGYRGGFTGNIGFGGHFRHGSIGINLSHCFPSNSYVSTRFGDDAPPAAAIDVQPGEGCYAGHITLVMTDGELTDFSLDQSVAEPSAESVTSLPADIQASVTDRVTKPCSTG